MQRLLFVALVGLLAQLIDGSMGMAYGVTSSSLMLMAGIAPAVVSASVHSAELVTTALSGLSHWRFGNVHWPLVLYIALPGAFGAFVGATFVSSLPGHLVRPYVAAFLFILGGYILWRFAGLTGGSGQQEGRTRAARTLPRSALAGLGLVAGFLDAVGGGGWGPMATPTLLARRGTDPRKVIGSVDTAEFLVTVAASAGFLAAGGPGLLEPGWVAALVAGGAIAAPVAARLVSKVPPRLLGVAVGGMVMLTNASSVFRLIGASSGVRAVAYGVLLTGWLAAALSVWARLRAAPRLPAGS